MVCLVMPRSTPAQAADNSPPRQTRPRYSVPPPGQQRGWIDIQQYNYLPDPVEAGRLLMSEAQLAGFDLDDSTRVFPKATSVHLPGGRTATADAASRYIRAIQKPPDAVKASGAPVPFLVKLRRAVTVREYATALMAGIRLSRGFSDASIVMAMQPDQVHQIANLPFVYWIQPFLPEYKYDASRSEAAGGKHIYVESLVGDQQVCRDDLLRCGATIVGTFNDGAWYNVTFLEPSVKSVAALWWVLYIETGTETKDQ